MNMKISYLLISLGYYLLLPLFPCSFTDAVLVGSILLPHGDFAYDPTFFRRNTIERRIASKIAIGSRRAGRWLIDVAKPDIVFVSTPHGIKLDNDFGIYMSSKGFGRATIGDDLYNNSHASTTKKQYNVSLEVNLASDLAFDLFTSLKSSTNENNNVSGIYSYDDSKSIPLNWGEIIPLLLLPAHRQHQLRRQQQLQYNHNLDVLSQKFIIWSMPHRRYDHGPEMVPELLRIGSEIRSWIENRPERIGVIISGDLSHTHQPDGPYGYSNTSSIFDEAMGTWVLDPYQNANSLLKVATKLQPNAMSCGYTGYVMWHGFMMCNNNNDLLQKTTTTTKYNSTLLVNNNVTYYGMMSAIFNPINAVDVEGETTISTT